MTPVLELTTQKHGNRPPLSTSYVTRLSSPPNASYCQHLLALGFSFNLNSLTI
jgi:hypothetical protein